MPTSPSTTARVRIRIENSSAFDFDDVLVFFPDQPRQAVHYGAIQQGAMSDYHPTTRAYRYAHVEVQAGDRHLVLRPTDYVGEEALPAGRFTYVLSIDGDSLRLRLRQDA